MRILSLLTPVPLGLASFLLHRTGFIGAFAMGIITAVLSVAGMLVVVGDLDQVPVIPETARDWRETLEFVFSIALAYDTRNSLGMVIFPLLPTRIGAAGDLTQLRSGLPACWIARRGFLASPGATHARALQGLLTSVSASLYKGLKGLLGN